MQQWLPAWCTAKSGAVDFDFDSGVNEYVARTDFLNGNSALTASTDVALVTDPASSQLTAGSGRKFTYAPIADTGIAIAYYVDNVTTGQPITNLKLDARLVAKLLTNSYSYAFGTCAQGETAQSMTCDPAVAGNPDNIFQDPEFYALNPEYTPADFAAANSVADDDAEPLVIAGNSDMTYELTRWIESDHDAAAFLAGESDKWGMRVNSYFKTGQTYPVPAYVKLDPGFSQTEQQAQAAGGPMYVATMQNVWNPITGQDNVDQDLLGDQSTGLAFNDTCVSGSCEGGTVTGPPVYVQQKNQAELLGERTLFAVVDTGDSGSYQFPTAELVNSAGNAVGPTTDSMADALDSMKTNPDKITQYQDFSDTSPNAYPLTEVQYAMVPTCGESTAKARAVSNFLTDVTNSQLYGTSTGELPAFGGYFSLTSAQKAQTLAAAQAVSSQSCTSPPPDTTVSGRSPGGNGSTGGSGSGGVNPAAAGPSPSGVPTAGALPNGSASAKASVPAEPVALGVKGSDDGSLASWLLPIALVLGGLLLLGGPLAYAVGTSGTGTSFLKRRGSVPPTGGNAPASAEQTPDGADTTAGGTDD